MILVVSNIANEAAARLVEQFPPGAASLITASSFNRSFKGGLDVNDFASSRFSVNGVELVAADITGIVTTISSFMPEEFYYIDPEDRKYVCAEMNAFFTFFLSQFTCKKINPPSVRSASGPNLSRIEWIKTASAAGVPIWPAYMVNSKNIVQDRAGNLNPSLHTVSIIGDKIIGEVPPGPLKKYLRDLRNAFDLPFLTGHFISDAPGSFYLAELATKPDISAPAIREAIVNYFS